MSDLDEEFAERVEKRLRKAWNRLQGIPEFAQEGTVAHIRATHSVACLEGPFDAPLTPGCPRCEQIRATALTFWPPRSRE